MEANPVEAVRNNALATRLMRAASRASTASARSCSSRPTRRSTPATVMGASKALAEWAVEEARAALAGDALRDRALRQRARLVGLGRADLPPPDRARRPGDRHRRAHDALLHDDPGGGPADHPRRARSARGGEVFVLEMGEPVSIMQLARDMIELSGLRPDEDIAIEVVGRRPGEKLHEELFNPYERPQPTPAEKIVARRARAARPDGRRGRASTRSGCSRWRATRRGSRRRSASSRRCAAPPAAPARRLGRPEPPLAWRRS